MELFRDRRYVDVCRDGNTIPECHRDVANPFYSFGYYSTNLPTTPLFLETWSQSREYFEGFEQPHEIWELKLNASGRYPCQSPSLVLLKPVQVSTPLDLRTKKSFQIENLTSDSFSSLSSNLHVSPHPSKFNQVDTISSPTSDLEPQNGHKRTDHSIRSFLPFVDRQDSQQKNAELAPLNLSADDRKTRHSSSRSSGFDLNTGEDATPILIQQLDQTHPPIACVQTPECAKTENKTYSGDEESNDTMPCEPSEVALVPSNLITCQQVGCQKTFHSKGALTIHAHRFHSCGTKDVRPRRCQQVQQKQRRSRDKPSGKTLLCSYQGCGKTFREMKHLKVHQMQHTDDRPLACELCSYNCRQRNSMNWHMKAKHGHEKKVTHDGKTVYLRREEVSKAS